MIGLRVRTPGQPRLFVAVRSKRYGVYATASCRQRRPWDPQRIAFTTTAFVEPCDTLEWFESSGHRIGSWIEIEVASESEPALPRRHRRRKKIDWNQHFARERARDIRRIAKLEGRLRRLGRSSAYEAPRWQMATATHAFRILLNGRKLTEVSVDRPGTLSVTAAAHRRGSRETAFLEIHGGERLGPSTYRWYAWPRERTPLEIGDRVRILVVAARANTARTVRSIDCFEPSTAEAIASELERLRANMASDHYRKEAKLMREVKLSPSRHYELAPRSKRR